MGSSSKKKSSKKADFQKPKLKVGKARPKPTNFTDTSFKSKAIAISRQSLQTEAPSPSSQFAHHVSLLTSHSDSQRRDSLAYLTTAIQSRPVDQPLPQPVSVLLPKLLPLTTDISNSVRHQFVRLLHTLPNDEVEDHVYKILLHVRVGLTHMAADIQTTGTDMLQWVLEAAGQEVVSCAGGWVKTLKSLLLILRWRAVESEPGGWSKEAASKGSKLPTKVLPVLALFLRIGLLPAQAAQEPEQKPWPFPLRNTQAHMLPRRSNAFARLNLFGPPRDSDEEMYEDIDDRRRIFVQKGFRAAIQGGVERCRREGGEIGRGAAQVNRVIEQGMDGFEESD